MLRLCLLFCFIFCVFAQDDDIFNNQEYSETLLIAEKWPFTRVDQDNGVEQRAALGVKTYWLLQVRGPISDSLKALINEYLAQRNTTLGHYFPHNTFLVQGSDGVGFRQFLLKAPAVLGVVRYKDNFKISPGITEKLNNVTLSKNFESITIRIQLFRAMDPGANVTDQTLILSVINGLKNFLTTLTPAQQQVVNITLVSNSSFQIEIKNKFPVFQKIVSWLLSHEEVNWVEEKFKSKTLNYYVNRVSQGDDMSALPLEAHGINGEGIIIGIGDTGIDYDHCFFRDQNIPVVPNVFNGARRKIVYYNDYSDIWAGSSNLGDIEEGHGTHVAGTAAGEVYAGGDSYLSYWSGIAHKSKISFVQMGNQSNPRFIYNPPYIPDYYDMLRLQGSTQISSNSWGSDGYGYGSDAYYSDKYMYDNPNFLILYAAGNAGDEGEGYGTIIQPSVAKNVVTVGASQSSAASFADFHSAASSTAGTSSTPPSTFSNTTTSSSSSIYSIQFPHDSTSLSFFYLSTFGPQFFSKNIFLNKALIKANPFNGCTPIKNKINNSIVLISENEKECTFVTKVKKAQDAGAIFVLFVNSDDNPFHPTPSTTDDNTIMQSITIPSALIVSSTYNSITENNITSITSFASTQNEWQVAFFSSRGPTSDGRIKPDILAPGQVTKSSRSDGNLGSNNCNSVDLVGMSGTSMATPAVAGLAALITQYYVEGYYPNGIKTTGNGFWPTSALIKATLIASGVSVAGSQQNGNTVGAPPDYIQGFGRAQLDTVLKFKTQPNKIPGLYIVANKAIKTGGKHGYCFRAYPYNRLTGPGSSVTIPPFKATLVWTDAPSSLNSALKLTNNLDLGVIKTGTKRLWMGNNLPNQQWDIVNNVEQVTLSNTVVSNATGTFFAVFVYGTNIPTGTQQYSLVVNGNFLKVAMTKCANTAAVCPNNCGAANKWGTCNTVTGDCKCLPTRAGPGCKQMNHVLTPTSLSPLTYTASTQIAVHQYIYYNFVLTATQVKSLRSGIILNFVTNQVLQTPDGLSVFVSIGPEIPSVAKFLRAYYTHHDTDDPQTNTWSWYIPYYVLPTAGGRVNFAFYGFCCSTHTVSATWTLT